MKPLWLLIVTALLPQVAAASVPDEVQLVVFEHFLPKDQRDSIYCLGVDGQDVSQNVIDQLDQIGPRLAKASDCTAIRSNAGEWTVHTDTGQAATLYYLLDFTLDGPTKAVLKFETDNPDLRESGNTVSLEQRDGTWHVTDFFMPLDFEFLRFL